MLRIGVDARPLTAPTTGIGRYTEQIIKRLSAERNIQLHLYAHRALLGARWAKSLTRTGDLKHDKLSSLFAQWRFPRWAVADRIDVFWSPRHHLPLAMKVPTVVTIHDLVWRKAPGSMATANRILERVLMQPSMRKASAVIAVSEATRQDILEWLPDVAGKTSVVYESAFTTRCREPSSATAKPYMLFVGTFEPRKNLWRLLQAVRQLRDSHSLSHHLMLVGRDGWRTDVAEFVAKLGLTEQVTINRSCSDEELTELYANCDFLVLPSLYEGFGLPALEAMAMGKPVLCANTGALPEICADAALTVDPLALESIVDGLSRIMQSESLRTMLSQKAAARAADFSWDRAAEQTLALLKAASSSTRMP